MEKTSLKWDNSTFPCIKWNSQNLWVQNIYLQDLHENRTVTVLMDGGMPYLYKAYPLLKRSLIHVSRESILSL